MSTAADFLGTEHKRRYAPLRGLDDWGLSGFVRSLTEKERSDYESGILDKRHKVDRNKLKQAKARLVVLAVVDDEHEPVFTTDHVSRLMSCDSKLIEALYTQVTDHIGFDADELVELAVGNESASESGSGSD